MGLDSQGTSRDASFRGLNENERPDPSASPRLEQKFKLMDTSIEMCLKDRERGHHRPLSDTREVTYLPIARAKLIVYAFRNTVIEGL